MAYTLIGSFTHFIVSCSEPRVIGSSVSSYQRAERLLSLLAGMTSTTHRCHVLNLLIARVSKLRIPFAFIHHIRASAITHQISRVAGSDPGRNSRNSDSGSCASGVYRLRSISCVPIHCDGGDMWGFSIVSPIPYQRCLLLIPTRQVSTSTTTSVMRS